MEKFCCGGRHDFSECGYILVCEIVYSRPHMDNILLISHLLLFRKFLNASNWFFTLTVHLYADWSRFTVIPQIHNVLDEYFCFLLAKYGSNLSSIRAIIITDSMLGTRTHSTSSGRQIIQLDFSSSIRTTAEQEIFQVMRHLLWYYEMCVFMFWLHRNS